MEARNLPRHMRAEITTYYSDIWTRHTGAAHCRKRLQAGSPLPSAIVCIMSKP